jgi:hypothetical protein
MYDIEKFEADRASELSLLNRQLIIDERHSNSMSASELEKRYSNKPVRLDVLAGNSDARMFYEKAGFQIYCHTMMRKN